MLDLTRNQLSGPSQRAAASSFACSSQSFERLLLMQTKSTRLFNCMPSGLAPDWTRFVALRVGACIDHGGETEGAVAQENADFFTVYGVFVEDGLQLVEAITDVPTTSLAEALPVARELAALTGLPLEQCRFLRSQSGPATSAIE